MQRTVRFRMKVFFGTLREQRINKGSNVDYLNFSIVFGNEDYSDEAKLHTRFHTCSLQINKFCDKKEHAPTMTATL